jgi:broad specificity phosphatase PhoE
VSAGAELLVVRHADTAWTHSGQHTGRTDIPLTAEGRARAAALAARLARREHAAVWTSPLSRAADTAALAGFPDARPMPDAEEWDYGEYDGLTSAQIAERRPGWDLWRDGCPGGESAADVGARADRLLAALPAQGTVLLFSHGHLLRVLLARWLGLAPADGALFVLAPAGAGALTHEHGRRVVSSWGPLA